MRAFQVVENSPLDWSTFRFMMDRGNMGNVPVALL